MTPLRHILVPIDFDDAMDPAIDFAVMLAERFNADIALVHVYQIPSIAHTPPFPLLVDVDALKDDAAKAMADAKARLHARWVKSGGITVAGSPASKIIEIAKEYRSDLIVIGTHARRGLVRLLLGSVADEVVRKSSLPVLTVHPGLLEAEAQAQATI